MRKTIVIKLGGSLLSTCDTSFEDVARLYQEGWRLVIIHGGGTKVNEWSMKLGVSTRIQLGERITDKGNLDIVLAVLSGIVNKETTVKLLNLGVNAVGLSGVDGGLIKGKSRGGDWGYTGDVTLVDPTVVRLLLDAGMTPVISPVSLDGTGNGMININGDTAAGELAAAIQAEKLVFLTDVNGIKDSRGELLDFINAQDAEELILSGVVYGGMVPKVRSARRASAAGTVTSIIDGSVPGILYKEVTLGGTGTLIVD